MDRFFAALLLTVLLAAPVHADMRGDGLHAQPVFFSMLFPQLTPGFEWLEATPGEAVFL